MSNYFVEDVVCKVIDDCGPCPGAVGIAVKFQKDEGTSRWLNVVEVTGIPCFTLTTEFILDDLLYSETEEDDARIVELYEKFSIETFEGIYLGEYGNIADGIKACPDGGTAKFMTYVVEVMRCNLDDTEKYISEGKGRYVGNIVIPDIDTFNRQMLENMRKSGAIL